MLKAQLFFAWEKAQKYKLTPSQMQSLIEKEVIHVEKAGLLKGASLNAAI